MRDARFPRGRSTLLALIDRALETQEDLLEQFRLYVASRFDPGRQGAARRVTLAWAGCAAEPRVQPRAVRLTDFPRVLAVTDASPEAAHECGACLARAACQLVTPRRVVNAATFPIETPCTHQLVVLPVVCVLRVLPQVRELEAGP